MTNRPPIFHFRQSTRRPLAFVGTLVTILLLAFWIWILMSLKQGTGGLFLTWIAILFSALVLFTAVHGILRPDAIECILDGESIRWHISRAPWRTSLDNQVLLNDIVEVEADLDASNDVDRVKLILRNGQSVELPTECFHNHARQLVEGLGTELSDARFSIVGNLVQPVVIRPSFETARSEGG